MLVIETVEEVEVLGDNICYMVYPLVNQRTQNTFWKLRHQAEVWRPPDTQGVKQIVKNPPLVSKSVSQAKLGLRQEKIGVRLVRQQNFSST